MEGDDDRPFFKPLITKKDILCQIIKLICYILHYHENLPTFVVQSSHIVSF